MIRSLLGVAALTAFLAASSVSAATFVRIATYEKGTGSRTCTEDQLAQPYAEVLTGECITTDGNGNAQAPLQYFCDTDFSYAVTYFDDKPSCENGRIQSIIRYDNRCRWMNNYQQFSCQNITDGTGALPFTFPPTGFAVALNYHNATDDTNPRSCKETVDVHAIASATNVTCMARTSDGQTAGTAQTYTCGTDGTYSILVYSNSQCTGSILHVTTQPVPGCDITETTSSQLTCGTMPTTPSSGLPTVGVYTYSKTADCNKADPSQTYKLDLYTPSCFDGTKLQCLSYGNATAVADAYTYSDATCSTSTPASETFYNANECIATGETASKKYVCAINPNPDNGNSAATNSVSLLAALFAAVAAFVAGKVQ